MEVEQMKSLMMTCEYNSVIIKAILVCVALL